MNDEYEKKIHEDSDMDVEEPIREVLPCIALRGVTIFPNTVVHFDIGREMSRRALEKAMSSDKLLFVATQKDDNILLPTIEDMYEVGTIIRVKQMLKIQGDAIRVLVEGVCRATIEDVISDSAYFLCSINRIDERDLGKSLTTKEQAYMRIITEEFVEYSALTQQVSDEVVDRILGVSDPLQMVDKIANELVVTSDRKQRILGALDIPERLRALVSLIAEENSIAELEKELAQQVKENVDNNQKEYFLREKMKAIQTELGNEEDATTEATEWLKKLDELKLDEKIDTKVRKEIKKFERMVPNSAESAVIRNYVETILDLPWRKSSKLNINLKKAEKILEEDHYGMKKVKERVLEYLAVVHLTKAIRGPILCLVGPPGVGKTSIARSIARATNREFVRMSLGGVRDEAEIRGHRRTYIGAIPGRVINGIKDAGVNNPLFLFDEVDKIGADFKGDPADALLEVLDPEQNSTFTDHFLEIPFDLSKVMFITTANNEDTIPRPLLDRMEIIEVPGYTEDEKVKIAERYLVPKQIKENGLKKENVHISNKALHDLVNYYTRESGVRNLEREIGSLCRKVARKTLTEKGKKFTISPRSLEKLLGKHRFRYDVVDGEDRIGVTTGLAWTVVGGDTLQIETAVLPGTGKVSLTGQLGDVMQESAKIGIGYIRAHAAEYGIAEDFYKNYDVHLHVPEGAVPKDGPSAGVTMTTALISALSQTPACRDVAMTGEVTLTGKVLPVGGIREKVLAAHRAGIHKVLLPKENERDLDEIPSSVQKEIEFVFLENVDDALKHALVKKVQKS